MLDAPFQPHSDKQDQALFSQKKILVLGTGTQYGKTLTGALRMRYKTHEHPEPDSNFIITAPSYPIMVQSTLPPFLRVMEGYGKHNKKDNVFRLNSGGSVWLRTETDPDSVVGITNVKHIWGDEAGKYRLYFHENLQARADFCGCGIDYTTSPYALNWIWKDLIKPWKEGKRPDIDVIQAASWENPYHSLHDPKARAAKEMTMDPRRFRMIYGGEFGRMVGVVYDCWEDTENLVEPFDLPTGTRYYGGVDWGFDHPFVLKVRAITPDGRHYGVSEFYKTGQTLPDMVKVAIQKKQTYGITKFFADPSQPGHIEEFNRNGLTCEGADNDIRRGIDLHYELIKTRRYKEFKGTCPHSLDERETYHYPEPKDLGPDDNAKDQLPVKQNDDAMDVDRYLTLMTYRRGEKLTPKVPRPENEKPKEDQFKRLDRLKRLGGNERGSEKWSEG